MFAFYELAPGVSGDLFPYKVRIKVHHGPTMLISQHSLEQTASDEVDELRDAIAQGKRIPNIP